MGIIDDIKKHDNKKKELTDLRIEMENKKEEIENKYGECNHDVIIKFYSNALDKSRHIPSYACLACESIIYDEEEKENKEIFDYTTCENGTLYRGDESCLMSYLRYLINDMHNNNKRYTDDNAINVLRNNPAYEKIPSEFLK